MSEHDNRTVTTVEELDALPPEAVIRTAQSYTLERLNDGWWRAGVQQAYQPFPIWLPATVLFVPPTTDSSDDNA